MGGNNECFENFERNKYLKKLPSMQRVMITPSVYHVSFLYHHVTLITSSKSHTLIHFFLIFVPKCLSLNFCIHFGRKMFKTGIEKKLRRQQILMQDPEQ